MAIRFKNLHPESEKTKKSAKTKTYGADSGDEEEEDWEVKINLN